MELFFIICLVVLIVICLAKVGGKFPLGCLVTTIILSVLFIKGCNDMDQKEQERKEYSKQRTDKLLKELDETRYMRTEEYQKEE